MTSHDLTSAYQSRYDKVLVTLAPRLEHFIKDILGLRPRLDLVVARAKTPKSFLEKAAKVENGKPKYSQPLRQILDQLAARVVVYYLSDVEPAARVITDYIPPIEEEDIIPDSPSEFGYEGKHFILITPKDILTPELPKDDCPRFFELQVKTLFQHAWAQADHDLGYKPIETLDVEQKRKIAFSAAQAWGADRIFRDLLSEVAPRDDA